MNRRHAHTLASPALTPGDDQPETPCVGRWDVFDALIDHNGGPDLWIARNEARSICEGCPIQAACFRENADEDWVAKLVSNRGNAECGSESGYKKHRRHGEPTCTACRQAQNEANKRRKAAKQVAA